MKFKIILAGLFACFAGSSLWAASSLNDLRWSCGAESCQAVFSFQKGSSLPSYYQKFDATQNTLRVAFSQTNLPIAEGEYPIDASSPWVRSVKISRDMNRNPPLLYVDFVTGGAIVSADNAVQLRGKTDFVIQFPRKKQPSSKAWDLKTLASIKIQPSASKESSHKGGGTSPLASKPVVSSVFANGLQELAVVKGGGLEQFVIRLSKPITASQIKQTGQKVFIPVAANGSTSLYNVQGSIAKGVFWENGQLVVLLQNKAKPVFITQSERVILQTAVPNTNRLETWVFLPSGVEKTAWALPSQQEVEEGLEAFAATKQKSASLAMGSGTIQLHQREPVHVVVDDGVALYTEPSDKSTIVLNLSFGEKVSVLEQNGLFLKVKVSDRIGYVSKRQIALDTDLTLKQKERLMSTIDPQKMDGIAVRFEIVGDEHVTYSSFGRRDPFIEVKGVTEDAINIDQTELAGIIWEAEVPMALLADTKIPGVSYTVREGDKILNGKVLKITQKDVLFQINEFGVSRRYSMTLPDKYGSKK